MKFKLRFETEWRDRWNNYDWKQVYYVVSSDTELFFRIRLLRRLANLSEIRIIPKKGRISRQVAYCKDTACSPESVMIFNQAIFSDLEKIEEFACVLWRKLCEKYAGGNYDREGVSQPEWLKKGKEND